MHTAALHGVSMVSLQLNNEKAYVWIQILTPNPGTVQNVLLHQRQARPKVHGKLTI